MSHLEWFTVGNIPPGGGGGGQQTPIWHNNSPNMGIANVLPPTVQQNPNTAQIEALNVQQNKLREQIRQSELNLQAQHSVSWL